MEEQELRTEVAELDIRDGHLEDRSTHLGMSVQESAGGWGPRRLALWLLAGVPHMSDMKPEWWVRVQPVRTDRQPLSH